MKSKFEQLRAVLTQEEWDNFLANLNLPESCFVYESLDEILLLAFCWNHSPQGHDYWEAIRDRIINNLPAPETFQAAPESTPQAEIQPQDEHGTKVMDTEIKPVKAFLFWSLDAYCPVCKQWFDLAKKDDDSYIAKNIFNNSWGNLKGHEITCPFCASGLEIKEVEY